MRKIITTSCIFAVAAVLFAQNQADAAIITSTTYNASQTFFAGSVSAVDQINGLAGTHTGFDNGNGRNTASLTNGVNGNPGEQAQIAYVGASGATSEYTLGTGLNGLGYDITEIRTTAAWSNNSLHNQKYDIFVRKVGELTFLPLTNVLFQPTSGAADAGSTQVSLTENTTGVLAGGVEAIRFTFDADASTTVANSTTFRELDVFATSTVAPLPIPEPSTAMLLGMGVLGIARRVRRRRTVATA